MGVEITGCPHCRGTHMVNRCPKIKNHFKIGDIAHVSGLFGSSGPYVIIHVKDELCYALAMNGPLMFHHQEAAYYDKKKVNPEFLATWTPDMCNLARLLYL